MNKLEKYISPIKNGFNRAILTSLYFFGAGLFACPTMSRKARDYNSLSTTSRVTPSDLDLFDGSYAAQIPALMGVSLAMTSSTLGMGLYGIRIIVPTTAPYLDPVLIPITTVWFTNALSGVYELYRLRKSSFEPTQNQEKSTLEKKVTEPSPTTLDPWGVEFPKLDQLGV